MRDFAQEHRDQELHDNIWGFQHNQFKALVSEPLSRTMQQYEFPELAAGRTSHQRPRFTNLLTSLSRNVIQGYLLYQQFPINFPCFKAISPVFVRAYYSTTYPKAATMSDTEQHHRAVIGSAKSFWIYDSKNGFDLTHPASPDSPPIDPQVKIETTTSSIAIDPAKSALVVVDMQNYFLSSALGRARGAGHAAADQLTEHAIPACRRAGIRIIWLNWGLSQQEIDEMPPAVLRAFGFVTKPEESEAIALDKHGNPRFAGGDKQFEDGRKKKFGGLGSSMGIVTDPESGKEIDAGRLLMRDQWNTALYPPLDKAYDEGKKLEQRQDVWIHKNRMSGMWGPSTACEDFLEKEGIKTLFFTGVNTDQCVGGTYQDCFSKGYDCILLSDGCGTTSPAFSQENMEFNAANTWGFVTTCKALREGAEKMQK